MAARTTLNQLLLDGSQYAPVATGELNALIDKVAKACKLVAGRVARGALIISARPSSLTPREEVELIEAYHREQSGDDFDSPLFGSRGLFRAAA